MRAYEDASYQLEEMQAYIYPWIKEKLEDHQVLNKGSFTVEDTPVIAFVNNLYIVFVIKRGEDCYELLKDNMLPEDINIEELYQKACENLVRDVEFVISNTWYGAFGIVADGVHEASSLCFSRIWNLCAEKLEDDLVITVPSKDMVMFAPAGKQEVVKTMLEQTKEAYDRAKEPLSRQILVYRRREKELKAYED